MAEELAAEIFVAGALHEHDVFKGVRFAAEVELQINRVSRKLLLAEKRRAATVFNVESNKHLLFEAEVPADCSAGNSREIEHSTVRELDVVNTVAKPGGLGVYLFIKL